MVELEKAKEISKKDLIESRESYSNSINEIQSLDRKFFDFRLAFAGFLGVILTIVFSNIDSVLYSDSNTPYLLALIIITILVFISILLEINNEAKNKISNLEKTEKRTILTNIRHIATHHTEFQHYGVTAESILQEETLILKAMKKGMTVDEIIKKFAVKRKLKIYLIWWSILFLSVPIIFLLLFIRIKFTQI